MSAPDYVVLRAPGEANFKLEGYWFDLRTFRSAHHLMDVDDALNFHPTNTFEVRADGAVAEVWEAARG